MKSTRILAIIVAAALPGATLLAQGEHGKMGDMKEMHQKMDAEMKAQEADLDKLVAEMSAATGDKKVDAVAAVVAKLVEQRKAMHAKMSGMGGDMMSAMECCKGGMSMKSKTESSPKPAGQ